MYSHSEFIDLCKMETEVFWLKVKGSSPNIAAVNMNEFERAADAHFKRNLGFDPIRELAVSHLATFEKKLWKSYVKRECRAYKFKDPKDGETKKVCAKHGNVQNCIKLFTTWRKDQSY